MKIRSAEYRDIVRKVATRVAFRLFPGSAKVDRWGNITMTLTSGTRQRFKVKDRVLRVEVKNNLNEWQCRASIPLGEACAKMEAYQAEVLDKRAKQEAAA